MSKKVDRSRYSDFIRDNTLKREVRSALDVLQKVLYTSRQQVTSYLTPRAFEILEGALKDYDLHWEQVGGNSDSERLLVIISPSFAPIVDEDRVRYHKILTFEDFHQALTHRDVLGAVLATGVERDCVGDIVFCGKTIELSVLEQVSDRIRFDLKQIGRTGVSIEEKQSGELTALEEQVEELSATVSSLRVDALLAVFLRLSREKAKQLVASKRVKRSFEVVQNPSDLVKEGDLLSVRGVGRFRFTKVEGSTKKGKYRVAYQRMK